MSFFPQTKEFAMKRVRITIALIAVALMTLGALDYRPSVGLAQSADPGSSPLRSPRPVQFDGPKGVFFDPTNDVDHKVGQLIGEYSKTQDETKRASIKSELTTLLDQQFNLQQKHREAEVKSIEDQLRKLHEVMKKRADNRQSIVNNRLEQLLREADGLGWAPPHAGNASFNFDANSYLRTNGIYPVPTLTAPQAK